MIPTEENARRKREHARTQSLWDAHWSNLARGDKGLIDPTPIICAGDSPVWVIIQTPAGRKKTDIITRVERGGVDVEAGPMQGRLWE